MNYEFYLQNSPDLLAVKGLFLKGNKGLLSHVNDTLLIIRINDLTISSLTGSRPVVRISLNAINATFYHFLT